ncbi:MAG: tRNA 2-thiouridine(34) synthase MnmA [Candidatus Promineofilum sp.]|nr:tRNA 2-thiouridine(34) synthase MnmA [Promineifilum sp.]
MSEQATPMDAPLCALPDVAVAPAPLTGSRPRVVVAMSGGVDSSVAAALLVDAGYEVTGLMMRLWSEPAEGAAAPANRCCTPDQMTDARRVADRLGIPFYVIDVRDHFRRAIVQFFLDEHAAGRTPNPCIECNRQIRFTYLLERALALGADYLATGHYARVRHDAGGYRLLRGLDGDKDQSYVLHMLGQTHLARVFFPIGEYTKAQVRDLARAHNLPVANKHDSQDLCFLKDGDYRGFLRRHSEGISRPGDIINVDGRAVGRHGGLVDYTIGQRKGLGIAAPEPLYVVGKDAARNALIVGPHAALGRHQLTARTVSWVGAPPTAPIAAAVKIRYKAAPLAATIAPGEDGTATVQLAEPAYGVTPGQAIVFYDGDVCLGGGLIAGETWSQPATVVAIGENVS